MSCCRWLSMGGIEGGGEEGRVVYIVESPVSVFEVEWTMGGDRRIISFRPCAVLR
jgi:hypothetical protein